jgi:leucyl/phenylalanyl-tRNA--protein transferase
MVAWLYDDRLPDPEREADDSGLVALGGTLRPELLLRAYGRGLFPWSSDPVLNWWSPDPRAIFDLASFRTHRSVRQSARRAGWRFSIDSAFDEVMRRCQEETEERPSTWITDDFVAAYGELHRRGAAHSVEVWQGDDLVGGLYGVTVGGLFGGESMFHRQTDASKAAVAYLVDRLRAGGFLLCDAQVPNPHLARLGAIEITRRDYLSRLALAVRMTEARLVDGPAPSVGVEAAGRTVPATPHRG